MLVKVISAGWQGGHLQYRVLWETLRFRVRHSLLLSTHTFADLICTKSGQLICQLSAKPRIKTEQPPGLKQCKIN